MFHLVVFLWIVRDGNARLIIHVQVNRSTVMKAKLGSQTREMHGLLTRFGRGHDFGFTGRESH